MTVQMFERRYFVVKNSFEFNAAWKKEIVKNATTIDGVAKCKTVLWRKKLWNPVLNAFLYDALTRLRSLPI